MVKSKSTERTAKEVQAYFFPLAGVSIEASSYEEAVEKLNESKKEVTDGN